MVLPYNLNRFGGGRGRPYYCEVEWIENSVTSTNTFAFTTNMYPRAGTSITMEVMPTLLQNTRRLTGATGTQGNGWGATFIEITGTGYWGIGNSASSVAASTSRRDKIKVEFETNAHKLYVNDNLEITYTLNTPHTTDPYGWSLGCVTSSTGYRMPARWYRAYQQDSNGNIIHDIVPVLDWDMIPCFYDKVTGELFYRTQIVGSGDISYGREIHYVDWLQSNGTQYIKTGIFSAIGLKAHSVFEFDENYSYATPFCTQSPAGNYYGLRLKHTTLVFQALAGSSLVDCGSAAINTKYTVDFTVTADTMTAVINGTTYTSSVTFNPTGTNDIYLFCANAGGYAANYLRGKIYEQQFTDSNGVLLADYRPAVDEFGVGTMFDRVTHTYYTVSGSGVFNYPDVECEKIITDGTAYLNTDIIFNGNETFKIIGMRKGTLGRSLFGGRTQGNVYNGLYEYNRAIYACVNNTYTKVDDVWTIDEEHDLSYTGDTLTLDGSQYTLRSVVNTVNFTSLFGLNNGGSITANASDGSYIKNVEYYNTSNELVRHYVPVCHSGEVCMKELVGGTYITNAAGSGKFRAVIKENK
jgi:hypothetical protein